MTKKELAELVLEPEELKSIDYSLPQSWVNAYIALTNQAPNMYYVWSYYSNKVAGEPVNLLERFYDSYNGAPEIFQEVENLMLYHQPENTRLKIKYELISAMLDLCRMQDEVNRYPEGKVEKKKSELIMEEAQKEDNDLKYMGMANKALRESRSEKFEDEWLPKIEKLYQVEKRNNGSYSIHTGLFGIIDYYPKANKLLIRTQNEWEKPGLKWLITNLNL